MYGFRDTWHLVAMPITDGQLMKLIPVPSTHIDAAYRRGASCLSEACDTSGGEITGDQLKMLLSRGERTLLEMKIDETCDQYLDTADNSIKNYRTKTVGWGVVRVDQLPNMRVLFITDLVAHNGGFDKFFEALKHLARDLGCSRVRCAAKEVQARLYRIKCGFRPVYEILEVEV